MSIKISEAIGFFSKRINIGQYFGREPEEVYVTMNEPNEDDQLKLGEDKNEIKKLWKKYLDPEKHNFEFEEKQSDGSIVVKPATKEQIMQVLSRKGMCITYIWGEWYTALPLQTSNAEK